MTWTSRPLENVSDVTIKLCKVKAEEKILVRGRTFHLPMGYCTITSSYDSISIN